MNFPYQLYVPIEESENTLIVGEAGIPIENLLTLMDKGYVAEDIPHSYPSLTLSEVYILYAFILRYRREIDDYLGYSDSRPKLKIAYADHLLEQFKKGEGFAKR